MHVSPAGHYALFFERFIDGGRVWPLAQERPAAQVVQRNGLSANVEAEREARGEEGARVLGGIDLCSDDGWDEPTQAVGGPARQMPPPQA